jgi:DNA-directed RNA polymerase subunit RPC12/RpoP
MIAEIKPNDTLKCLRCGKTFKLELIGSDEYKEYIDCPHCKIRLDIQTYHILGEPQYDEPLKL